MTKRHDDLKNILKGYFNEEHVDAILPKILEFIPESSNELRREAIDEIEDILYDFADENELFIYEFDALISQIVGELPVERPKPYKPKTIKVNVTKENSEVWLNQRPEYSEGCKFIEILREAVEKNIGSFEVPQNYPAMDEYARLIFVTEKELKRRRLDFNFYEYEDFGKKNGVVIADKYYFVLYVVSIMNKYLEKSEETAENIFDAICAMYDDERGKYEDVMRIREKLSGEISFDISRMVASTGDNDNQTIVSLPFCIDEDFFNKADNGADNVAFYIIAS